MELNCRVGALTAENKAYKTFVLKTRRMTAKIRLQLDMIDNLVDLVQDPLGDPNVSDAGTQ